MPRSLADGHIKLAILATKPTDPTKPTLAELNAGIQASPNILDSDFKLGPTKSDTIDEKSLAQTGKPKVLTNSNYEANITSFRDFDATGKPSTAAGDDLGDSVYQALKTKGTMVYLVKRFTSKLSIDAWAAADPVQVYKVLMDQAADAEPTGYVKARHPCEIQDAWLDAAAVA